MDNLELIKEEDREKYEALNYDNYAKGGKVFINANKNSLSFFKYHNEEILMGYLLEILKEKFDLSGNKLEDKFYEVVSGDGQELNRICTLISSSLCAFLHFYNVSKSNPLKVEIDGETDPVKFTEVYFEVQNNVISNPSNVDILLISNDQKILLFLESKFSEYLNLEKGKKVSSKYKEIYEKYNIHNGTGTYYKYKMNSKNSKEIILSRDDGEETYIEGVKQMISHHIGVCNFINNDGYKIKNIKKYSDMQKSNYQDYKVVLGEIVFDGWQGKDFKEYNNRFELYKKEYKNICVVLNSYKGESDKKPMVLNDLLTYQDLFRDNEDNIKLLNEKIRKFYKYE